MIKGVIAGAFDIYHPGYVQAFKEAKEHCDVFSSNAAYGSINRKT